MFNVIHLIPQIEGRLTEMWPLRRKLSIFDASFLYVYLDIGEINRQETCNITVPA